MKISFIVFLSVLSLISCKSYSSGFNHQIEIKFDVAKNTVLVADKITIPASFLSGKKQVYLYLNKNLKIENLEKSGLKMVEPVADNIFNTYVLGVKNASSPIVLNLKYSGIIFDSITSSAAEYARGFSETSGIVSSNGIYLANSTYWFPIIHDFMFNYSIVASLPNGWNMVSQGKQVSSQVDGNFQVVRYENPDPTDEIYLTAYNWTKYSKQFGDVAVEALLRVPDSAMAFKYIDATSSYLKIYESLIGKYPYQKFSLVENFWETGYGMPSFTLLGPKIIRFPFIINSSYPHELLHNYWGNSVYVDYQAGNWCEGITAYMADHLLKEQAGQGEEYRRTTIQKYTDFVGESNDFPLVNFVSRNNPAQEAIGYGKALMMNHALRQKLGDEVYMAGYQAFYRDYKFKKASWSDIEKSMETVTKEDLTPFFYQWLQRTGAPSIKISNYAMMKEDNFQITFGIEQVQQGEPFFFKLPVAYYFEDEIVVKNYDINSKNTTINEEFVKEPIKLIVDPRFDVFRTLDRGEVSPSLSQVFGSDSVTLVLPAKNKERYNSMAETWKQGQESQGKFAQIITDESISHLDPNKSYWIFGFENKFADLFNVEGEFNYSLSSVDLQVMKDYRTSGALVFAKYNPGNNNYSVGFVGSNVGEAVAGLARLLPHYGKYSYLAFKGTRPENTLKGVLPVLDSPMIHYFDTKGKTAKTPVLAPSLPLIK